MSCYVMLTRGRVILGNGDKYDSIKWRTYDSEKWRKYDFVLAKKLNRYDAWFP